MLGLDINLSPLHFQLFLFDDEIQHDDVDPDADNIKQQRTQKIHDHLQNNYNLLKDFDACVAHQLYITD